MKKCFLILFLVCLIFVSCQFNSGNVSSSSNVSYYEKSSKTDDAYIVEAQGYKLEVRLSEISVTSNDSYVALQKEELVDGWMPYYTWAKENGFYYSDDDTLEKDYEISLFVKIVKLIRELSFRDEITIGANDSYSYYGYYDPLVTIYFGDGEAFLDTSSLESNSVDHRVVLVRESK